MDEWLKSQLEKMDLKLDKYDERQDRMDITLVKQQAILDEHQKRSLANEKAVEVIATELKPVKEHVLKVNFIIKVVLWTIGSITAIDFIIHQIASVI